MNALSHLKVAIPAGAFTLVALVGAIVCTITHHDDQANLLYGVALGGAGAGAVTPVIASNVANTATREANGNGNGAVPKP